MPSTIFRMRDGHRAVLAGAALVAVAQALHSAYYLPRVVDDLFISLRYAENLVAGRGLVFNPGERVEGYSSPAWMLLQAAGLALGLEGVAWTKALALASIAALHVALFRFAREVAGVRPLPALVASALLAANSYVAFWTAQGLETTAWLAALVGFAVALDRLVVTGRARSARPTAALAISLLALRPEAPLYVAALALAALFGRSAATFRERLRATLRWAAPVAAASAVGLLARLLYFGHPFPHTFYAKHGSGGLHPAHLASLWAEGASHAEAALWLGGVALLAALAWTRRSFGATAIVAACAVFTASVEPDWMPSLRHLLPITVVAPVGWAWAIGALLDRTAREPARRAISGLAIATLAGLAVPVCRIDARMSARERGLHGDRWLFEKTRAKAHDAWLALLRREPRHVADFSPHDMGMLTQNFRVLGASGAPVESSWYVGRDIGAVGYYTGVRVFDTAGLFTPEVVAGSRGPEGRGPTPALIRRAFERDPIAAELFDGWDDVYGAQPELQEGRAVVRGSDTSPDALVRRDEPPSPEEWLARHERSLAKFPRLFHLQTLYGETVGAAMEKRVRFVRQAVADETERASAPTAGEPAAGATIAEHIDLLGCRTDGDSFRRGREVRVRCWFRANARIDASWWVFAHFEHAGDDHRFQADHAPVGGRLPTYDWEPGRVVEDVFRVRVPDDAPIGTHRMFVGMFRGSQRAAVTPRTLTDGHDRVRGPDIEVR